MGFKLKPAMEERMVDLVISIKNRVSELYKEAMEIEKLSEKLHKGENTQPELQQRFQSWYRACLKLFEKNSFSGIMEFQEYYSFPGNFTDLRRFTQLELEPRGDEDPQKEGYYKLFKHKMNAAIALILALPAEVESEQYSLFASLSYELITDEYEQAEYLLSKGFVRAAGAVAGVSLERHLHTLATSKNITVVKNPPTKPKAGFSDYLTSLKKAGFLDGARRKQFETLYEIRKQCAHPEEPKKEDVERLIKEGKLLASVIK